MLITHRTHAHTKGEFIHTHTINRLVKYLWVVDDACVDYVNIVPMMDDSILTLTLVKIFISSTQL